MSDSIFCSFLARLVAVTISSLCQIPNYFNALQTAECGLIALKKLWIFVAVAAGAAFKKFFGNKKNAASEDSGSEPPQ
jgi:hypothetical protein